MATLVQDVWLGGETRLRGRRFGPFDTPAVRVVFHLDLGATLDDPPLVGFLETLGGRLEVFAYEPRGQGASAGRHGPELAADLEAVLDGADRRWPDRLPIVVAGHGLGASLALALAGHPGVVAGAALAPLLTPPAAEVWDALRAQVPSVPHRAALESLLGSLDLPRRVASAAGPLLAVVGRDDLLVPADAVRDLVRSQPAAALVTAPGDHLAPLRPPWVQVLAEWISALAPARGVSPSPSA